MHIANTDVAFCDAPRINTIKQDEKATLGNRFNPIPYPGLDTKSKWKRNTYNLDAIK